MIYNQKEAIPKKKLLQKCPAANANIFSNPAVKMPKVIYFPHIYRTQLTLEIIAKNILLKKHENKNTYKTTTQSGIFMAPILEAMKSCKKNENGQKIYCRP
jgi:hypothetical protein